MTSVAPSGYSLPVLDRVGPPLLALLHLGVSAWARWGAGVNITADPQRSTWDYFWQTLPAATLRDNLGEAILYLHMQPPLYNLWGAFWLRTMGERAPQAMHTAQMVLGALVCAMLYTIARAMGLRPWLSAVLVGALAMMPALLLYEAYFLYEVLTLFFLTATLWSLAKYQRSRRLAWLLGSVVALNALVLTRSSFHLIILVPAIALLWMAQREQRGRFLLLALLISLPSLGWYAKNQALFGFFGASSWQGMNLWRIVGNGLGDEEREALVAAGNASPLVAEVQPFALPSKYVRYGFDATFDQAVLSADDFNNGNIIGIGREYGRAAGAVLRADPLHYARNVLAAYARFHRPTSTYDHLATNRARLPGGWLAAEAIVHGLPWMARFGSITALLVPLCALLLGIRLRLLRRRGMGWRTIVRAHLTMLTAAMLCAYVVVVGSTLEYGENERFRFVIEPHFWLLFAATIGALIRELRGAATRADAFPGYQAVHTLTGKESS